MPKLIMRTFNNFLVLFLVLGFGIVAHAAPGSQTPASASKPLEITSNQMDLYPDQKKVVFSGNVVAIQDTSKITAATLTAFYTSESQGLPGMQKKEKGTPASTSEKEAGALDKIMAAGNVIIIFDDMTAKADRAEFNVKTNILTLYGDSKDVEVQNADGIIRGKTIVANRDTGETIVKSSPKRRVQAIVFSTGDLSTSKTKKKEGAAKSSTASPATPTTP